MAQNKLPLLIFPKPKFVNTPANQGFLPTTIHLPSHIRQVERLTPQIEKLEADLSKFAGSAARTIIGGEPELVLVLELAKKVDDFKRAMQSAGLEWLGEWDDEIEADEDFYSLIKIGKTFFQTPPANLSKEFSKEIQTILRKKEFLDEKFKLIKIPMELSLPKHLLPYENKIKETINQALEKAKSSTNKLAGRLYVSIVNQQGMNQILSLWKKWQEGEELPPGKTKWRDIFACLKTIRRWGRQETLEETGMKDYFERFLDEEQINFQIECFYRKDENKRRKIEKNITHLVNVNQGVLINSFIDKHEIGFHAVKASMPAKNVKRLLSELENSEQKDNLFVYPNVMYFRQTGQSIVSTIEGDSEQAEYLKTEARQLPIAAILDGMPNLKHKALENHINFDDPFNLENEYQAGERKHGTSMASLIIHGDRSDSSQKPIRSKLYHVAVMQPDVQARDSRKKVEHFPSNIFYEDRIEQAVRRILDKDGEIEAQAPTVKIINLSLGDPERPFIHTPSPWARLLDSLSWKYRVLFCVSAGNYTNSYNFDIPFSEYQQKSDDEKIKSLFEVMQKNLSKRRLLAPAESINSLTVGALHQDESGNSYHLRSRIDLLLNHPLLSPISCLGHGFRSSVKPEIYFPGGRQLYKEPSTPQTQEFHLNDSTLIPGQKVACDSNKEGEVSQDVFTRGTSNATALATRAGIQIHEVLSQLNDENQIPDELMAVVIKALLVHGAIQGKNAKNKLEHLRNSANSKTFKTTLARYLGYGAVDINRVLACTEQRGTVIGFGEITTSKVHEYRFPIPSEFGSQSIFRRMIVTLAWFSPMNTKHRYLREAKLEIQPTDSGMILL